MEIEQMILIIVIVILGIQLLTNLARGNARDEDNKLMFAYLENNERNVLKMEEDIKNLDYLIMTRTDP